MDLLPSSPTVPAGGSKHRRLGFYALPRTQQKHQVPNDENLQIESKLIQVIPYGERTKGKRSIWSETTIHRKSLTSDCSPSLGHLRISRLLGSESPVANPEVYQQGAAEDQALCGTAHSNKFCRCVSRPLNTATHPPPPPARWTLGLGVCTWPQNGWHSKHSALPLCRPCVPPSHPNRSQPLPVTNKGD